MGTEDQGLICEGFICSLFSFAGNSSNCLFVHFIADAVESKMGLVLEDDVDWFLTLDETHHKFLTVGARDGAAAGHYINPSFPQLGEQCIVSTFHTTGVYGTTLRGEPLTPLYILSTGSLQEEDYRIDVYTPCFEGRISPEPIHNPLTNKFMEENGRAQKEGKGKDGTEEEHRVV